MKQFTLILGGLLLLGSAHEAFAQRSHGPAGGSVHRSAGGGPGPSPRGPSGGSVHRSSGPSYHPAPSRPTPSYHPAPSRPTPSRPAPSYHPAPSRPTPSYHPTPSRPTPGPVYHPTPSRPGTTVVHRPWRARPSRPVIVSHHPWGAPVRVTRWNTPYAYHRTVLRSHIYRHWIFWAVPGYYRPGYRYMDGYPWYIYNGYRHRYSPTETCTYDLIDTSNDTTVRNFGEMSCNLAYDQCARERDAANAGNSDERFTCAEHVEDDLANNDDSTFEPAEEVEVDATRAARIQSYLDTKTNMDAYNDAVAGKLGDCKVFSLRGNVHNCSFRVKIAGQNYPDEATCSVAEQAAVMNCNVGTEQENTGCILKDAVENARCI